MEECFKHLIKKKNVSPNEMAFQCELLTFVVPCIIKWVFHAFHCLRKMIFLCETYPLGIVV